MCFRISQKPEIVDISDLSIRFVLFCKAQKGEKVLENPQLDWLKVRWAWDYP